MENRYKTKIYIHNRQIKEFILMLENTPGLDLMDRLVFPFVSKNEKLFEEIMKDLGEIKNDIL